MDLNLVAVPVDARPRFFASLLPRLRQRDFSKWFRSVVKDDALAAEAEQIERRESRIRIRDAIEKRYTLRGVTALRQVRALAFLVCAFGCAGQGPSADVLVFTRTTGFRHASIPAGIAAMRALCAQTGHSVDATEDPAVFRDAVLSRVKAVVFLNTTGTVLSDDQRAAIERWVSGGGGFLGVHSAADTEYGWPFYGELLGARFASHPAVQSATVHVIDRTHPATAGLPETWMRTDEWYDFVAQPSGVRVLAEVDESTYLGGRMGAQHPIAWTQAVGAGRSIYIAMGHTEESYSEELFRSMLLGALRVAAGDVTSP